MSERFHDGTFEPLVTLTRGGQPESVHYGEYVVVRDGEVVRKSGNPDEPIFMRSAIKPFQAMAGLEAGTAERYGLTDDELVLMCASHNGEDCHTEIVQSILDKGGFQISDLGCGVHPPIDASTRHRLRSEGVELTPIHNNCSGKHAGMLLLAKELGQDPADYLDPDGATQQAILATVARWAGRDVSEIGIGVDGCSAANFAFPLTDLALAFARLAGSDRPEGCDGALADRMTRAIMANPYLISGSKRNCDALMKAGGGKVVGKAGAEGVYGLGVPGENIGVAVKIADGADRPVLAVLGAILLAEGIFTEQDVAELGPNAERSLKNHRGVEIGRMIVHI